MKVNVKSQSISFANISIALTAIGTVAGFVMGATQFITHTADTRYVQRDSFAAYESGTANRKSIDSLTIARDLKEIRAAVARVDTNVLCLRKPQNPGC